MAANPKRNLHTVTGFLPEANWKDNTAEVYPDKGGPVKLAFSDELADDIRRAARRRVRVTGSFRRPGNGRRHLEVDELQFPSPLAKRLVRGGAPSTKRGPFAGAKPIEDVSVLLGGLPDDRTAEEIIADMESCRAMHYPPYQDEEGWSAM
jgi:hypothetical protein